jgi:hypothetical protein
LIDEKNVEEEDKADGLHRTTLSYDEFQISVWASSAEADK